MSELADAETPNNPLPTGGKSVLRSRTVWLQLLTLVASLVPAVQGWLVANPVEAAAVLAALNVLVRFTTRGRIYLFSREGGDAERVSGGALREAASMSVVAGRFSDRSLPPCSNCGAKNLGSEAHAPRDGAAADLPTLPKTNMGGVTQ